MTVIPRIPFFRYAGKILGGNTDSRILYADNAGRGGADRYFPFFRIFQRIRHYLFDDKRDPFFVADRESLRAAVLKRNSLFDKQAAVFSDRFAYRAVKRKALHHEIRHMALASHVGKHHSDIFLDVEKLFFKLRSVSVSRLQKQSHRRYRRFDLMHPHGVIIRSLADRALLFGFSGALLLKDRGYDAVKILLRQIPRRRKHRYVRIDGQKDSRQAAVTAHKQYEIENGGHPKYRTRKRKGVQHGLGRKVVKRKRERRKCKRRQEKKQNFYSVFQIFGQNSHFASPSFSIIYPMPFFVLMKSVRP